MGKKAAVSCLRDGSGMLPLPWPSGPHVAGYQIQDSKQKTKPAPYPWGAVIETVLLSLIDAVKMAASRGVSFLAEDWLAGLGGFGGG